MANPLLAEINQVPLGRELHHSDLAHREFCPEDVLERPSDYEWQILAARLVGLPI
jgi:hypothetical protein